VATCYRHPNRETGVSCSNCGRPICPDCMTPTPVGMRCPECARQRTSVRSGGAAFGFAGEPRATYVLIAINVAVFLAELVAGGAASVEGGGSVIRDFGIFGPAIADGEWYRIVTGGFLHAGFLHIAFNMYALYILGSMLEPAIGTARFLAVYAVSLLAGSFGALLLEPDTVTVGASGAIFGIFGVAFLIARGRGMNEVASQLGVLLLINLAFTFGFSDFISVGGHLGGLVGGSLAGLLIVAGERGMLGSRRVTAEMVALTALAVVAAGGALIVA
jgi:membrane associated rhomboid family serine protease